MTNVYDGILDFGDFTLDRAAAELRRDGQPVPIEPQVFELIAFMAANPKRVLSRDELMEAVWRGRVVSDSAISSRINAARRALGDDGRRQGIIKTIHGRGFRWEPEPGSGRENGLSELAAASDADVEKDVEDSLVWPEKPSVAVLPFEFSRKDERHGFFADGVTEDVILGLSRLGSIFVIARNSCFSYKDKLRDNDTISRELGVRYLVVGSVRVWKESVRVSAQLVDTLTGRQVWSEAIDGQFVNVLSAQDEIARSIVSSVHTQLLLHEGLVSERKGVRDQRVTDLLNRAWRATADWKRDDLVKAQDLARRALERDRRNVRAHIVLALVNYGQAYLGYTDDPGRDIEGATVAAQEAIRLAPNDEYAQWIVACCAFCRGEHDRSIAHARRAIEINPNFSWAHGTLGTALAWAGQGVDAILHTETALRYNPRDPTVYFRYLVMALSHFGLEDYETALDYADRVIRRKPDWYLGHAFKIASLDLLDRRDEAARAVDESREFVSRVSQERLDSLPFKDSGVRDLLRDALVRAGFVCQATELARHARELSPR